jgi:hypothetical protein
MKGTTIAAIMNTATTTVTVMSIWTILVSLRNDPNLWADKTLTSGPSPWESVALSEQVELKQSFNLRVSGHL